MPTSKKRVKKNYEEAVPITKNPLKTRGGKIMIIVLIFGFVGAGVLGLILILIKALEMELFL